MNTKYQLLAAVLILVGSDNGTAAHNLRRQQSEKNESTMQDLSKPFDIGPMYNTNMCADKMIELASNQAEIRGLVVLERGKIVAEYYRPGINKLTKSPVWSVTKAFTNLVVGKMQRDGFISFNETLGDIFEYDPYDAIWGDVDDAEERKALTIESIVTMTAGLSLPDDWFTHCTLGAFEFGSCGGLNFKDSLTYHDLDPERTDKEFDYLTGGNLMSYVIYERSRLDPEEFSKRFIFPLLGITENDYNWQGNLGLMNFAWHGLFMTPRAMAKLGMLYLQRGHSSSTDSIVSEQFVLDSARGTDTNPDYGYGLWNVEKVYPERPNFYAAGGLADNIIGVNEDLGRVIALTSDNYTPYLLGYPLGPSALQLSLMVNDPSCSFETV